MSRAASHGRLDRPGLAPVWDELARRLADGGEPRTIVLRALGERERRALADLLGLDRLPGRQVRLPVDRLAAAAGVDGLPGLRAEVEARRGPIADRRSEREAAVRGRAEMWAWFGDEVARLPLASGAPGGLSPWVASVRAAGVPGGDVEVHRSRLGAALRVLVALPADGASLASLASDTLGDPHGLDRGRWTSSVVLAAVADALDRPAPSDAEAVRNLWEGVGVAPDPLSSTVLTLGLRPGGDGPLASWLRTSAEQFEPVVLTLAQLRRWPVEPLAAGTVAYVVENPSLVAEATRRRVEAPPLVCSSGRPTVAVVTLLRQLAATGATLRQHADFDATGLSITNWLADRAGTTPWRMGADDYAAATPGAAVALAGRLPPTPWDPGLAAAMASTGRAVHEEDVRATLLEAMANFVG